MNQVTFSGNVGKAPTIRMTQSGQTVASFSVAAKRPYKDQSGQTQFKDTWMDVTAWGALAESVGNTVKSGARVIVIGRIDIDEYQGNDGQKRRSVKITAEDIGMLLPKRRANSGNYPPAGNFPHNPAADEPIPF